MPKESQEIVKETLWDIESAVRAAKGMDDGPTMRERLAGTLSHQEDLKSEKEGSPLWKHCLLEHSGVK